MKCEAILSFKPIDPGTRPQEWPCNREPAYKYDVHLVGYKDGPVVRGVVLCDQCRNQDENKKFRFHLIQEDPCAKSA